jgi:hypothetical protein
MSSILWKFLRVKDDIVGISKRFILEELEKMLDEVKDQRVPSVQW